MEARLVMSAVCLIILTLFTNSINFTDKKTQNSLIIMQFIMYHTKFVQILTFV
jgi:hypothetical protein